MQNFVSKPVKIDPKKLILDLMLAAGDRPMPVRDVILAGSLFEISENHLRVMLARLSGGGTFTALARRLLCGCSQRRTWPQ